MPVPGVRASPECRLSRRIRSGRNLKGRLMAAGPLGALAVARWLAGLRLQRLGRCLQPGCC